MKLKGKFEEESEQPCEPWWAGNNSTWINNNLKTK